MAELATVSLKPGHLGAESPAELGAPDSSTGASKVSIPLSATGAPNRIVKSRFGVRHRAYFFRKAPSWRLVQPPGSESDRAELVKECSFAERCRVDRLDQPPAGDGRRLHRPLDHVANPCGDDQDQSGIRRNSKRSRPSLQFGQIAGVAL